MFWSLDNRSKERKRKILLSNYNVPIFAFDHGINFNMKESKDGLTK